MPEQHEGDRWDQAIEWLILLALFGALLSLVFDGGGVTVA